MTSKILSSGNETVLRRGRVFLAEYAEGWSQEFIQEKSKLLEALAGFGLEIELVGSTAVPGLSAKPIIDIAVAVPSNSAIPDLSLGIEDLGYIFRGDLGADGGHLFVKESAPNIRTHHLHVVSTGDPQWHAYLRFRDRLRSDERLRMDYSDLKSELSLRFPFDRRSYTAAKKSFIERIFKVKD